jgi:hypothetical protein
MDATFTTFWELYPKKVGKKECHRIWSKLGAEEKRRIQETLPERVRTDSQWAEGKFIPNPSTYLNQGRWDDDYPRLKSFGNYSLTNPQLTICEECKSHPKSRRHEEICNQKAPYFDGWSGEKKYKLCPSGTGVVWL